MSNLGGTYSRYRAVCCLSFFVRQNRKVDMMSLEFAEANRFCSRIAFDGRSRNEAYPFSVACIVKKL